MMNLRIVSTSLAVANVVFVSACGSGTAPKVPATTVSYALVTIDGKPLPLPEETDSSNVIESGRVELIGDDSARVIQTVSESGAQPITVFQVGYYSVQRNGSTLIFYPHYLANPIDTASVLGGNLTMRTHVVTAAGILVESRMFAMQ
jgi:hypothetical protein